MGNNTSKVNHFAIPVSLILSLMLATMAPMLLTTTNQQAEATHIARVYSAGPILMNGPAYCSVHYYSVDPEVARQVNWELLYESSSGQYPSNSIQLRIDNDGTYLIWFGSDPHRGGVLARGRVMDIQTPAEGNFRIIAEETLGKSPVYPRPLTQTCVNRDTPVRAEIFGKCDGNAYIDYESENSLKIRFIGIIKCIQGEHLPEGATEPFPPPGTVNKITPQPVK